MINKSLQFKYDKRYDVMHIYFEEYSYVDDADEEYSNIYIFRNEVTNNITKILVIDFMKNKDKLREVLHQYNISYDEGDIVLNGYK